MKTPFTLDDAERANDEWGANCGPGALAAVMELSLAEIRPRIGEFESKHYTNPTLMFESLDRCGAKWKCQTLGRGFGINKIDHLTFPKFGLARIQWEGPWMNPGVPVRARYRQTHWVGSKYARDGSVGIFDINCLGLTVDGTGWTTFEAWAGIVVPYILEHCVPRADGKWHITHSIEIESDKAEIAA
jgi:hypothetical protein